MASQLAGVGEAKSVLTVDLGNLSHDNNSLAGSGHLSIDSPHCVLCEIIAIVLLQVYSSCLHYLSFQSSVPQTRFVTNQRYLLRWDAFSLFCVITGREYCGNLSHVLNPFYKRQKD